MSHECKMIESDKKTFRDFPYYLSLVQKYGCWRALGHCTVEEVALGLIDLCRNKKDYWFKNEFQAVQEAYDGIRIADLEGLERPLPDRKEIYRLVYLHYYGKEPE